MRQAVPTWVAVVVIIVVLVIVVVGYWVASNKSRVVQPPETFQPGKTAQFVPQQQGAQQQPPAPQGQ
jgi:ABC-type transporter Mla subunit MlaD